MFPPNGQNQQFQQGGGGGGARGFGGGGDLSTRIDQLNQVISAGGITLTTDQATRLNNTAADLEASVASGGTLLPQSWRERIGGIAGSLERAASTAGTGITFPTVQTDGTFNNGISAKIDEFLSAKSGDLSPTLTQQLEAARATADAVFADGTVAANEQASLTAAASALRTTLDSNSAKLTASGLNELSATAAQERAWASAGFVSLDQSQLAAFQSFSNALQQVQSGAADRSTISTAADELRTELSDDLAGKDILGLTSAGGGHGGGFGGGGFGGGGFGGGRG